MKLFLFSFLFIANAQAANNVEMSIAADMIYSQGISEDSNADDKLLMRGAELSLYAPIDHQFDGLLSMAAHDEGGETVFELHEMNIASSKIIPRSNFKIGQFFLGLGKLNHTHQHDWSFIRAPYYHEVFFDSEGTLDTGVEYDWVIPWQSISHLTLGITSGHKWGHSHTAGARPKTPTHYLRYGHFIPIGRTDGIEWGLNGARRNDSQGILTELIGFDFTFKLRHGKIVRHKVLSETWFRHREQRGVNNSEQLGTFIYYSYGINESFSLGHRLDVYRDLSQVNSLTQKKINNIRYNNSTDLTYNSSEFAKIKTTVSHDFTREEGLTMNKDTRFEMQFVFILGSHPAHEF